MVQEAEPPYDVPVAVFVLYGCRDDLRFRLATDRNVAILTALQQILWRRLPDQGQQGKAAVGH